jgi:uncharacterized membrane-anchored protein
MTEPREYGAIQKDLDMVVSQVQKLTDEYHALQLTASEERAGLRKSVEEVRAIAQSVCVKIPDNLEKRLVTIELQLQRVIKDTEEEFVKKMDFVALQVEHNQIKRLVWGFIIMVLTSVIGGLLALVVHNAAVITK